MLHFGKPPTPRLPFLVFSSVYNSINLSNLVNKMQTLGLSSSLCLWIKDVLTNRPQHVKIGSYNFSTIIITSSILQGCPLFWSTPLLTLHTWLYTHLQHWYHFQIQKINNRVIVGVVAWGEEVVRLAPWCKDNILILNTKNPKGIKGNGHWPQEKAIHHREIHIN